MAMARSRTASIEYAERLKQLEAEAAEARRARRATRKWQAEQASQQYFADRAAEADLRTRTLADQVAELRTILERGLRRSPRIDLAGMRAEFSQPTPDLGSVGWRAIPPDWSRYEPPPPSVVDRLAGNARYRQQLADARAAYETAMAEYERAEAERQLRFDEARRRYVTRLAEERRRVEDHNRRVDAFVAALRRREHGAVARFLAMVLDAEPLPAPFPRSTEVTWPDGASWPLVRFELPGPEVVPATTAVRYHRPTDELRELPRPAEEVAALHRSALAQVVLLCLRDLFVADPRLDAVTFAGHVRGVEVIRVDTRRAAVEALAGLDLPPDAALATLSILDPGAELRWAS
jgi:restriction system protein